LDIVFISNEILLTDRILTTNYITNSLVAIYKQVESDLENLFVLENKLLLYYNYLIVFNTWNLCIYLIQEVYNQVSTIYLRR
jgi:hypothetical protein